MVAPTPMDRIPVYARAGAVVPIRRTRRRPPTGAARTRSSCTCSSTGRRTRTSRLVEDDGLTLALRDGAFRRTTTTVTRSGSRVVVEGVVAGDGYPEHRRERFGLVLHGASPATVVVDGSEVAVHGGVVRFANSGSGFRDWQLDV